MPSKNTVQKQFRFRPETLAEIEALRESLGVSSRAEALRIVVREAVLRRNLNGQKKIKIPRKARSGG